MNKEFVKCNMFALLFFLVVPNLSAQVYKPISGWSEDTNNRIESFLNTTRFYTQRKVAVFDADGTIIGQVPHYLADEALYEYASKHYAGRNDAVSEHKLSILHDMAQSLNYTDNAYLQKRMEFMEGMTTDEITEIGYRCFQETYHDKIYPEAKQLINNLKEYNFEIWIITASPELLYQKFLAEALDIPATHIIGAKTVATKGRVTSQLIPPIPQEQGKADAISTYIKTEPLIVCGNSRGDLEMMNESCGLKIVINPDNKKVFGTDDLYAEGYTLKQYWEKEDAIIVNCADTCTTGRYFHTQNWGIKQNPEPAN